jgi:hypothetical protein
MGSRLSAGGRGGAAPAESYLRDVAPNATVTISSEHGSFARSNAIDGSTTTMAATVYGNTPPHWFELNLGAPKLCSRWRLVQMTFGEFGSGNNITDGVLQYYDGAAWQAADTLTGNTLRVLDRAFPAVSAQRWRLYVTGLTGDQMLRIQEISLFEKVTLP